MIKTCIVCGRKFEARCHQQKTCSEVCGKARENQRRKNYSRDRFPWSEYRHAYYVRNRDKVKAQMLSRRNRKRHLLCIDACFDYLAHLDSTYGYTDAGAIRATINSWHERTNRHD